MLDCGERDRASYASPRQLTNIAIWVVTLARWEERVVMEVVEERVVMEVVVVRDGVRVQIK